LELLFACHPERSEGPAFSDPQGKLRDEGPVCSYFSLATTPFRTSKITLVILSLSLVILSVAKDLLFFLTLRVNSLMQWE